MNRILKYITILIVIITVYYLSSNRQHFDTQRIQFTFQSDTLSGVLVLPKTMNNLKAMPLVIFIHGDGALNQNAFGYYEPIWNALSKKGIACLSWDKKGVNQSTGNWLDQSMTDRALECIAAISYAKEELGFTQSPIGLMGFSQAGWVIPKVAALSDAPDFMIMVSPAINWKNQSNFLTQKRLESEGADSEEIAQALENNKSDFSIFDKGTSYEDYLVSKDSICSIRHDKDCPILSKDRYQFIQKNIDSDATNDIKFIKCPTFIALGTEDLNVNYKETYQTYQQQLQNNYRTHRVKIYNTATHGLLKSTQFNYAHPGLMFLIKFRFWGRNAFVDDFLNDVSQFAMEQKS